MTKSFVVNSEAGLKNQMAQARIICIVGMHRSGTSMIAGLVNRSGLDLGPADRLLKADKANPLGHFEHRGFLDIDRKLLKHFRATWHCPPDLPPNWENAPSLSPLLHQARALAASFPRHKSWGWKEPRASLFLPFWRKAIPNMRFLICLRNPLEVAQSLEKRNHKSIADGAWLWYLYTLSSLRDTRQCPRLFSFFDDYFARGNEEIRRVLDFCGLEDFHDDAVIESAIESELRHNKSGDQRLRDEAAIPGECKKLYLGLRSILASPELRTEIPNETQGAGISSTVDSFVAEFDSHLAFRYFSQSRIAGNKNLLAGQALKNFLKTFRGA